MQDGLFMDSDTTSGLLWFPQFSAHVCVRGGKGGGREERG